MASWPLGLAPMNTQSSLTYAMLMGCFYHMAAASQSPALPLPPTELTCFWVTWCAYRPLCSLNPVGSGLERERERRRRWMPLWGPRSCVPACPASHWLPKTARDHWKLKKATGESFSWPGVHCPAASWLLSIIGDPFHRHLEASEDGGGGKPIWGVFRFYSIFIRESWASSKDCWCHTSYRSRQSKLVQRQTMFFKSESPDCSLKLRKVQVPYPSHRYVKALLGSTHCVLFLCEMTESILSSCTVTDSS